MVAPVYIKIRKRYSLALLNQSSQSDEDMVPVVDRTNGSPIRTEFVGGRTEKGVRWGLLFLILLTTPQTFAQPNAAYSTDQREVIEFLNKTINWYQQCAAKRQMATTPSDISFANNGQPVADQVVQLSFEFARAKAGLLSNSQGTKPSILASTDTRYLTLLQNAKGLDTRQKEIQAQIGLRVTKKISSTCGIKWKRALAGLLSVV
jgi:hypothetical protein